MSELKEIEFSFFLSRNRDAQQYPKHKHDCCEIVFYADAEGSTFLNGEEFPISNHSIALIPTNLPHYDSYVRPSQVYCVGFFTEDVFSPTVFTDRDDDFILFFEEIEKELKRNSNNSNKIITHCLSVILLKILRHGQAPDTDSNINQRLRYVEQYIKSNFYMEIDFQKLAYGIGYSYDHFRHMFKEAYGISPKQFMLSERIDRAKHLLRNSDEKIKQIAAECGYRQSSQFISAFQKAVGVSPSVYRSRTST